MARPKKQLTDAEAVKMRDVEAYTHDDYQRYSRLPRSGGGWRQRVSVSGTGRRGPDPSHA